MKFFQKVMQIIVLFYDITKIEKKPRKDFMAKKECLKNNRYPLLLLKNKPSFNF